MPASTRLKKEHFLSEIIDRPALERALEAIAAEHPAPGPGRHAAIVALLKETIARGRELAQQWLNEDGQGRLCAERLSHLMDEAIRALHHFTITHVFPLTNPSSGERLAVIAVGGYGRGTLAPGSDIDLLCLLPYQQTAWGESVVASMLYVLWDLGLKVGHATSGLD
jgi:[protein-PII] uridylyltransferase